VAVNCCVLPNEIEGFAGVTAIEDNTGDVTVSVVAPLIEFKLAVIVVLLPTNTPVANPTELMVATLVAEELHEAVLVRSCVLPSLYVPMASNCTDKPAATVPFAGVTAMDTSAAGPTVSVVEPHTEPAHALTVAEPAPRA